MSRREKVNPTRREIRVEQLVAILQRVEAAGVVSAEDLETLRGALDTLAFLTRELEAKGVSIKRLRALLFGASTEKTSRLFGKKSTRADKSSTDKKKRKGHGRNGAKNYPGAHKVAVPHPTLQHGQCCPGCQKGKLYGLRDPEVILRVQGMAPLSATLYELGKLRCNLCQQIFTAQAPEDVGEKKYDETATTMVGVLKYGTGLPFTRLETLQRSLGIPMPAATQWELVARAADLLEPVHEELIRQAAQGEVLYNDDTTMKILELTTPPPSEERTGVFTSGIVSTRDGQQIALFFTGHKHAGENLSDVLARRAAELSAPIQMCDLLSRNSSTELDTILAGCNSHSRRKFVEVAENFPEECRHILEEIGKVYRNDAITREQAMSPQERLSYHQAHSAEVMENLKTWMNAQLDERKVEPNSGLGEAIGFMLRHWERLTRFLSVPNAPLDNNVCERALKKAILMRKNSYFYKTENGARVGDMFMSLIHTAELCGANPFDYLVALQRHHEQASANPSQWMPWNYKAALARLTAGPTTPPS
jgi:hypothetical protein